MKGGAKGRPLPGTQRKPPGTLAHHETCAHPPSICAGTGMQLCQRLRRRSHGRRSAGLTAATACGDSAYAFAAPAWRLARPPPSSSGMATSPRARPSPRATASAPSRRLRPARRRRVRRRARRRSPAGTAATTCWGRTSRPNASKPRGLSPAAPAARSPVNARAGSAPSFPGRPAGRARHHPSWGTRAPSSTTCGPVLSCNSLSSTCLSPAGAMASCAPDQACTPGDVCVGQNAATGVSGTCQLAVGSLGGACSSSTNECDFYAGLTCDTQSMQCVAAQLVGAGQACNYVAAAGRVDVLRGRRPMPSAPLTPGTQGTCAGSAPVGGACDLAAGPFCIEPSRCIVGSAGGTGGTCQIPDGTMCP